MRKDQPTYKACLFNKILLHDGSPLSCFFGSLSPPCFPSSSVSNSSASCFLSGNLNRNIFQDLVYQGRHFFISLCILLNMYEQDVRARRNAILKMMMEEGIRREVMLDCPYCGLPVLDWLNATDDERNIWFLNADTKLFGDVVPYDSVNHEGRLCHLFCLFVHEGFNVSDKTPESHL